MRRAEGRHFELVGWFDRQTLKKPNAPWFRSFTERMFDEDYGALTGEGKLLLSYIEMHAALVHRSIFPADPRWLFRQMPILDDLPRIETLEELARPRSRSGLDVGWIRFCDPSGGPWPPPLPETESPTPVENSEGAPTEKSREEHRTAEESRAEKTDHGISERAKADQRSMGGESREEGQESTEQPEPPEQRITEEAEGKPGPERVERGNTLPPISVHPPYPLGAEILRGSERCHDLVEQPPPWGRADARLLGRCVGTHLRDLMDPLCEEWVEGVYKRLRLPWPMDSPLGRQETGSFRSLYEKLMDGPLPQTLKRRILAHDLAWAEKEGWRKRNRKRGAVFCTVHNKRVRQYLLDMGPAES